MILFKVVCEGHDYSIEEFEGEAADNFETFNTYSKAKKRAIDNFKNDIAHLKANLFRLKSKAKEKKPKKVSLESVTEETHRWWENYNDLSSRGY